MKTSDINNLVMLVVKVKQDSPKLYYNDKKSLFTTYDRGYGYKHPFRQIPVVIIPDNKETEEKMGKLKKNMLIHVIGKIDLQIPPTNNKRAKCTVLADSILTHSEYSSISTESWNIVKEALKLENYINNQKERSFQWKTTKSEIWRQKSR